MAINVNNVYKTVLSILNKDKISLERQFLILYTFSIMSFWSYQPAADVPGNGPSDQKRGVIRDISTI